MNKSASQAKQATAKPLSPAQGILQHKCDCGNHTVAGGECTECSKKSGTGIQRSAVSNQPMNGVSPIVHDVLRSSGQPLDPATRAFMEPKFRHDFSQIPVHLKTPARLQTKLTVNMPGDNYEQEADRIADQVLAAPAHSAVSGAPPHIQRYAGQATEGADTAPASVDRVLASSGRPLEPALRQDMEQRFGHDFSRVRVHSGRAAEQSAQDVNANAYTVGHNIVFGAGRFAPASHEGQRLIAHELTHVVQQSGSDEIHRGQSTENRALSPISLQPQGVSHFGVIQREMNPACKPFLGRNQGGPVCKPPPSAQNVGNKVHPQIQNEFIKVPDQLKEVPIPGSGNTCSQSKLEPQFAQGKADLVRVVERGPENVQVEIAEIKPLNIDGYSLGLDQVGCYRDKLRDAGRLCKSFGKLTPEKLKEAEKDKPVDLAFDMCRRLNALGKTVTVKEKGLEIPPQSFELFGRPMTALTCEQGLVCYTCIDPEQKSQNNREPSLDEVLANPGSEVAAGFVAGFLAGSKRTIPVETWTTLLETLSKPMNLAKFTGGQFVGRPLGVLASLGDLLGGLASLLMLALKLSPAGMIASELRALGQSEESPTVRRARKAKDLYEGLRQLGAELNKNPNLLFESGEGVGNLCGEEAGKRFLKEFVAADPFEMGIIAGKVQGYIATEIAMLFVGAEEFAVAGKAISGAARAAKTTGFGLKILKMLEEIKALKRVLDVAGGASRIRIAAELEEAAKVESAAKALKAGETRRAFDKARELKAIEEAAEEAKEAEEAVKLGKRAKAVPRK